MAEETTPTERIVPRIIEDEMKTSYLDYSMSVIVGRALPDVRDGLKPVHRRVLYGMYDMGVTHNKPFKKSARVVGDVMGKYHPHGDTSIYDSLVRMAQDFSLRYPLVQGQGNFGCFTADTKVRLTDGRNLSFTDLVREWDEGKKNYTFTVKEDGQIGIAEIKHPRKTKDNAEILKITLDNGAEIKCTLNHLFMLKNCRYKEAQELKPGESLMPCYARLSTAEDDKYAVGYEMICQPKTNAWSFAHHLADEFNIKNGIYAVKAGKVRHHKDFNKLNNNPDNIVRMQWKDHWLLHARLASQKHKNDLDYVKKIREGREKFWSNKENHAKYSERLSKRNTANWQDNEYRKKMILSLSEVNKKYYEEHPELKEIFSKRATSTLKRLWKDPVYKQLFHEKIVAANKKRLTNNTGKAKFLRICHETLAEYRTLNATAYEATRQAKFGQGFTSWETGIKKYFNNDLNVVYATMCQNHKVVAVEKLNQPADVYDLTVEDTHNFLLAAGVFVHNSVDGDRPAAMRYCVSGDTLVVTDNGLLRIKDILRDGENTNIKILSKDKKVNTASKWFDSGEHPTLKIMTYKGYSLQGSFNHPVLTVSADGFGKPIFVWKTLDKLRVDDILVLDRSDALWPNAGLSLKKFFPILRTIRTPKRVLPVVLDENLAFILGALISEGFIGENKIEFCNTDEFFVSAVEKCWKKVFPDSTLHKFKRNPSSFGKKQYCRLECHCRYTIDFLKNLGLSAVKSADKTIPHVIFQSPRSVVAKFLQSYFEGDGSISYAPKMIELSCCSVSSKLIEELQVVLLRFGIDTFRRFDKYRNTYKLYVRGARNILKFYKDVGFFSSLKNKKLEYVVINYKKDTSQYDYVPFISDFIRDKIGYSEFVMKNNFDRYSSMERNYGVVCQEVQQKTGENYVSLFEYLLTYNYLFEKIINIAPAGVQRVFSIRVDSSCHSFIANGFINHNTECRMKKLAEEMLQDIDKNTVKSVPNYDGQLEEPVVLPSKIPNLLLNGSSGIAVGMATNIPPHNLKEVCDGVIACIDQPAVSSVELMSVVSAPDFPTGGIIVGTAGLKDAYTTGRGKVVVRAKSVVEEVKGKPRIIINEIPYMVNKSQLIEQIAELVRDKKVQGITDLRDESDRDGLRVVIELKSGANPDVVLNQLFKHSRLQESFGIIMLALVNNEPKVLALKDMLQCFVEHRQVVVRRRVEFDLQEAQKKAHLLEGMIVALDNIDDVIVFLKATRSTDDARQGLMADYNLSEVQAQAILDMKLQKLTSLEQSKIRDEHSLTLKDIAAYQLILASEERVLGIIKNEMLEIKEKYGDARRTQVIHGAADSFEEESLIKPEDMVVTVTRAGYIKRLPADTYKQQQRGGKGVVGAEVKDEDIVEKLFVANTHDSLLFFTNLGKVHWLKVYQVPEAGRYARGTAVVNVVELAPNERVSTLIPVKSFVPENYLFMITKKGIVKKTSLSEFANPRKGGILAIDLEHGDSLITVELTDGKKQIIMATAEGLAVRFDENDVRPVGRSAKGVIGIRLKDNDFVVGAVVADETKSLLTITELGYGKRSPVEEYRLISRGGVGVINIKITDKNGRVVAVRPVTDVDEIMLISQKGVVIRVPANNISVIGRNTQGVRVMRLEDGDKIVATAIILPEEQHG